MADIKDIVECGVNAYFGNVQKYSVSDAENTLRKALVAANNGNTSINYRDIRDGKCQGLFAIVEEILGATTVEGLQNDEYFNTLVDFRNVAMGDAPEFLVENGDLFTVAKVADGTQGIRRQRCYGPEEHMIPTTMRMVRIYEELNRVLSGRVDFNKMIEKVGLSFRRQILDDVYSLWASVTANDVGGAAYFPVAGAYSESALLDVVAHVEAATGKPATILGTKKALRKLNSSITNVMSNVAKEDIYNFGYMGKFYGTPVVAVPQRHQAGSTSFVFSDTAIDIVAGDEKPIKVVYEGNPLIIPGNPANNADLTQEYVYGEKYGVGLVLASAGSIGRYTFTA